MSIESKIKELLAESSKPEEVIDESVEEVAEEVVKPTKGKDEPSNKKNAVDKNPQGSKAMKEEADPEEEEADSEEAEEVEAEDVAADEAEDAGDDEAEQVEESAKRVRISERELKVDVSEDVSALTDGEELSEEFKTKAATIFEAAVVTRIKAEMAKIEEEFESRLDEEVESIKEGLVDKVDGYLDYVVEQWIERNEIALESGMKSDILEGFVSGLKNLFEQHYIDVPEEKYDVLAEMEETVQTLESKLDETTQANVALAKQVNEMVKEKTVEVASAGLSDTDVEKFKGLAEELSFEDVDSFKAKLQTIRESYFGDKKTATFVESVVSEDAPVITEERSIDPVMARYASALYGKK